jgi:hypothetical protein
LRKYCGESNAKKFNLPIKAVDWYQRAANQNSTISYGNLARMKLNAGFFQEAKQSIAGALSAVSKEPFIAAVSKEIAEAESAEEANQKRLLQSAIKQQQFVRRFGQAYFHSPNADFAGVWQHGTSELEITQNNESVFGSEKGSYKTMEFRGTVVNSAAAVIIRSKNEVFGTDWEDEGTGFIFMDSTGQIHFMRGLDADHETEILERKPNQGTSSKSQGSQ